MAYSEMTTVWGSYVPTGTGQNWCVGVRVYEETSWRTSTRCYLRVQCVAWSSGAMDVHANGHVTATNDSDGWWEGTFSNSAGSEFTFYQWDTWYGRDTSARSVSFGATFNVTGGFGNGSSSATATVSLPAKPSWKVTYSANGGSGAPSSQTKWAGDTLTLSKTVPTRANHEFLGWATSSSGAAAYQPGGSYVTDAALALYAVWRLTYSPPAATLAAMRVASASATAESPMGGYVRASLAWSVDASANASNAAKSVTCRHRVAGGSWASVTPSGATTGKSGTAVAVFPAATTSPHEVELTVTDALGGSATRSATVGSAAIPLDVANQGRGVGILAAAPSEGLRVASASATAESPMGGYVRASLAWSVDASANASNAAKSVTCRHRVAGGSWASVTPSGATTGKSGTAVAVFPAATTSPHEVELTVTDALGGSATRSATVGSAAIPLDVANQGRGVGILAAAPSEGLRLGGLTLTGVASSPVASRPFSGLLRLLDLAALTQGWTYLWRSSSSAGDYVRWRMLMGVVYLEVCHVPGVGAGGWKCGTLPASARLPYNLYLPMTCWHDDHTAMAWVGGSDGTDAGEVWLYNNGSNYMYGMASWPVYAD